ncbi:MAG: hypothetical protein H0W72_06380 [Planctomycetes bacterium]|nr:hypothetical protein [Planctomycetota bacterium]
MSVSTLVLALSDVERLLAPRLRARTERVACRIDGEDLHVVLTGLRLSTWLPRCDAAVRLFATVLDGQVLEVRYLVAIDGVTGALLAAAQHLGGGRLLAQWLVDALGARAGLRSCGDSRLAIALGDIGWPTWCRIDRITLDATASALVCAFTVHDYPSTPGDAPCPV